MGVGLDVTRGSVGSEGMGGSMVEGTVSNRLLVSFPGALNKRIQLTGSRRPFLPCGSHEWRACGAGRLA